MGCASSNSLDTRPEIKSNNYAYNQEERKLYEDLMKKNPNLEDGYLVFNKQDVLISEKDGIIYKEYKTIKMVKTQFPYSGIYEYTPMYMYLHKVKILDIRVNNIKSKDYKYVETENNFKISIPYTVEKEDDPLFTFEVVFSYRYFYADVYAQICVDYDSESCFSLTISSPDFHFLSINNIFEKYKFEETKNKITLSGTVGPDDALEYVPFMLMKNTGVKLDNYPNSLNTDFYFIDKSEKKAIEDSINDSKEIGVDMLNWVFSRDIIKIVGNKAYVKSYEVLFNPRPENSSNNECDFETSIHDTTDLKITNFKISNKPAEANDSITDNTCFLHPKLTFANGEYFKTIELEYSFTLRYNEEEKSSQIDIYKETLLSGSNYELYIKKDNGRRIEFKRDVNTTSSKEYDIILKGKYKTFEDDLFHFNVIKILN